MSSQKSNTQRPTLSLCMIVKNEEYFLPQCLDSVKDVVDEIIVVDTGSDDRTVEIAESYGCKVYHHPWEGSFSKARNISLSYATCDWILVMDPDEELERGDIPVLKELLKIKQVDVIYFLVSSDNRYGWSRHYSHRVFRRGIAHYEGIVHNQLIYKGNKVDTQIRLYHYGYNLSEEKMQAKFDRTQALLEKQLKEDKTNPFAQFNYLRVLRVRELWKEAAESGKKALDICASRIDETHMQMIVNDTAYCLVRDNKGKEAEKMVREVLRDHPDNLDLLFTMAAALVQQKKHREALVPLCHFLKVKKNDGERALPRGNRLIVDTYTLDHRIWANIADCYFEEEEYDKGVEAATHAITINPNAALYKISLARNLLKLNRTNEARQLLEKATTDDDLDENYYVKWYVFCCHFPELGDGGEVLQKGLRQFPKSDKLHNSLAYSLSDTDFENAEKEWKETLNLNSKHIGAYLGLVKLYIQGNMGEELHSHIKEILTHFSRNSRLLKTTGKILVENEKYEQAIDVLTQYLAIEPEDFRILMDISTCYIKLGQYEAAFLGYQMVLKIDPENQTVMKNMRILEKLLHE